MLDKIIYKTALSKKHIKEIERITRGTGFFSEEEIAIALELAIDSLNNPETTYRFLIVEVDNKVLAYTCYGEIPATKGSFDLYWIVTDKNYQGQGLGKDILNRTHKVVKDSGGRLIYAETSGREQYTSTRKFYIACGYKEAAVFKDFYQANESKYVYEFRL